MPLTSNRIAVSDPLEAIEYCYRENLTDGLPVVPPTEKRVQEFLDAVGLPPDHVIGEVTERARVITAEKLAINAVMAGCLPRYMPVLIAAVEALCDPAFKFNHLASLGSPWPLLIVSGPVVKELEMNYGMYLFGSGNRANATIGRAISLLLWNCCELRPDAIQRGQLGSPQRYSFCIAENPDTAWEGLNEWEGYPRQTSTVTVLSGYYFCMARTESSVAKAILAPLVNAISRHEFSRGCYVVIIPPNLEALFVEQGWSKRDIRDYLFAHCKRSVKDLKEDGRWGRLTSTFVGDLKDLIPVEPGDEERWVYLFRENPELDPAVFHEGALKRRADVLIVAAGGDAGIAMGFYQPYSQSTNPVTKPITLPRQ
ncbi:MAG: hypothetical protein D6736_00540 [Nitrospinota bacterium]|nr:MAG: hypothetical protein D6736_00540 [Nitrospinota bacterium]